MADTDSLPPRPGVPAGVRFLAHSAGALGEAEPLAVHLTRVAARAEEFARPLGLGEAARAAGLLHDLGKYSELFLRRLEGRERGLDHWSAGAAVALRRLGPAGSLIAPAIAGHHVGLADKGSLQLLLRPDELIARLGHEGKRLTESDFEALVGRLVADGLALPPVAPLPVVLASQLDATLEIRLLFSALVDADYLETEAHFEGAARRPGPPLDAARALAIVRSRVAELGRSGRGTAEVQRLRADLFAACLEAAEQPPGLYTLTAPTGSGKTLAMLAFALAHAARHGLARVVTAIPYLSIVEQTVSTYRKLLEPALGPDYVLEHHSLADAGDEGPGAGPGDADSEAARRQRQLAENWDAPLVVTTNVQLLESLFAHRPARCRKLHRLAGSVLLLDEVQSLPAELAVPTLAALSRLAARCGTTVVFATATQPAFDHLDKPVRCLTATGWRPTEIAAPALRLFDRVRRVRVAWEVERPVGWLELAGRLAEHEQVLTVVNLKRHALDLTEAVARRAGREGVLHLSTNLCPAHREAVLADVRRRLRDGLPCRLVATQCVEAGVDLDFPAVFRALGPLESIAQAAGRCNRNGERPEAGEVVVFLPEDARYPGSAYEQAAVVAAALRRDLGDALDLDDPATFQRYFRTLYDLTGNTGRWAENLKEPIEARNFPKIAELYRLIRKDAVDLLVPYDPDTFAALRRELDEAGHLTRGWIRRARRHAVALYRGELERRPGIGHFAVPAPLGRGERSPDWFVYVGEGYDRELRGLVEAEQAWIA